MTVMVVRPVLIGTIVMPAALLGVVGVGAGGGAALPVPWEEGTGAALGGL